MTGSANLVTAEATLAARSLRVTLRLECGFEDHPIFLELSAPDPHSFLEVQLPVALAAVAPKTLHRLLESIAEHLRAAHRREIASSYLPEQTPATPAPSDSITGA